MLKFYTMKTNIIFLALMIFAVTGFSQMEKGKISGDIQFGLGIYRTKLTHKQLNKDTTDRAGAGLIQLKGDYAIHERIGVGLTMERYGFLRSDSSNKEGDKSFSYNFAIQGKVYALRTNKIDLYGGVTVGYAVINVYDGKTRYMYQSTGFNGGIDAGLRWFVFGPVGFVVQGQYAMYNFNADDGAVIRIRASGTNMLVGLCARF